MIVSKRSTSSRHFSFKNHSSSVRLVIINQAGSVQKVPHQPRTHLRVSS
jgi:hypothetical protein